MASRSRNGPFAWCCPRCRRELVDRQDTWACEGCGAEYRPFLGMPDFRLSVRDNAHQTALAEEFLRRWDELSYADMIRLRFGRLREKAVAAGRPLSSANDWLLLDEQAHLDSYRTRGQRHVAILRSMLATTGHGLPTGLLADVGCGWGRDLVHLAAVAGQVVGVDISAYSLLMARKLCEEMGVGPRVCFVLAQGEYLPFPPAAVDAVNCSATIEHFPEPGRFLREASRCLKPGGWLFLYYPNRYSLLPETHTGIWALGWLPSRWQGGVVRRLRKDAWNVCLFSRRAFTRLLRDHFEPDRFSMTGVPDGVVEFLTTSKFTRTLGPLVRLVRLLLRSAQAVPLLARLVSFFAPVHFVVAIRRRTPAE